MCVYALDNIFCAASLMLKLLNAFILAVLKGCAATAAVKRPSAQWESKTLRKKNDSASFIITGLFATMKCCSSFSVFWL